MADFSLRDLWWLQPKGPDNPLPALQLGAQIAQNKASRDLHERQIANEIAITSLRREEMLYKQKLQTSLVAGNAAIAGAIASVEDWTDMEQVQRVYEVGAQYPMVVGSKAWQGAEYMHNRAVQAKNLQERAQARTELDSARLELQELLNDSRIELNDARILDLQNDIAFGERRMAVQEGNLALRGQEIAQKGQKLSLRQQRMYDNELKSLNSEEAAMLKSVTDVEEAKRLRMNYNLRRRQLTEKFYGASDTAPKVEREGLKTAPPLETAPQPLAPEANPRAAEIRESFRQGKITKEQAAQQLRELGFK